jgi:hypothetical protein
MRMAIRRLLKGSSLGADEIDVLTRAFDRALRLLNLVDRDDPLTEMVARTIVEVGASTIREPNEIARAAIKKLGIR